ncbi:MAG: triose-phosphate isomerase [Lachnospiraceae bacterium]
MRKKIVAGNWKMNKTPSEAVALVEELKPMMNNSDVDIIFCVPAIDIVPVSQAIEGTQIQLGAQNMYYEPKGAYTGEISASMLTDCGVRYIIIGHSERRGIFHETNEIVHTKVKVALDNGLIPILCCGESLEQREAGITLQWIEEQITAAFTGLTKEEASKIIVAYEPIWAIGTGKVATSKQAQEVCQSIRSLIGRLYNDELAQDIRILYGGSVNAANAAELFAMDDIDGGLVGGASLKAEFGQIVNYNK